MTTCNIGRDDRTRTCDLTVPNRTLYQLSYIPIENDDCRKNYTIIQMIDEGANCLPAIALAKAGALSRFANGILQDQT